MAVNGWLAADSDMHVMEPADLWQRYMDPRGGTPCRWGSRRSSATCGSRSRTR